MKCISESGQTSSCCSVHRNHHTIVQTLTGQETPMITLPSVLRHSVPDGVTWSAGRIEDKQWPIFHIERASIDSAVEKRQAEFIAGRTCARQALISLGIPSVALPVGNHRCPRWPRDVTGSITHSREWAAAIVAKKTLFAGVGVDIEQDDPLDEDLHRLILRHEELESLPRTIEIDSYALDVPKLLFSIKEAVFKTIFPVSGRWIDFQDVSVQINFEKGVFLARFTSSIEVSGAIIESINGAVGHAEGQVLATAFLGSHS